MGDNYVVDRSMFFPKAGETESDDHGCGEVVMFGGAHFRKP
jgi:hypothetical protein